MESLLIGFKNANQTKLAVKTRAIETLPLILQKCATRDQADLVCKQVSQYIAHAFPMSSQDLTPGSASYVDYMAQLDQVRNVYCFDPLIKLLRILSSFSGIMGEM